ncbi:MAG TPA: CBS domain-containing protein [Kofleriaceae bacterium]|nr:CBS domain-containing protein [Kofleriaceae bacterium]
MNVEELMTKPAVTIQAQESLSVAAQKMWDNDCGVLPVVGGDGRMIGILTDRDICMSAWSRGRPLNAIGAEEAMSKQVFSVKSDSDIGLAELLMVKHQVRRLPIVDANDKPVGMISMNDFAREAARPGSRIKDGFTRAIQTLAAICQPRKRAKAA